MIEDVIVSTNWCAHADGRANNPNTSRRMYRPDYLRRVWLPAIKNEITPAGYFVYSSKCDVNTDIYILDDISISYNITNVEKQKHAHDAYAGIVAAAEHALVNDCNLLYVEQDCLVHNIPAVLSFARDHLMCYGSNEWAYNPGWSEESLMWIANSFLPQFINRINVARFWNIDGIPEPIFNGMFGGIATPWPFGFGRKRPIDFRQDTFYAQQLSDDELDMFLYMKKLKY